MPYIEGKVFPEGQFDSRLRSASSVLNHKRQPVAHLTERLPEAMAMATECFEQSSAFTHRTAQVSNQRRSPPFSHGGDKPAHRKINCVDPSAI